MSVHVHMCAQSRRQKMALDSLELVSSLKQVLGTELILSKNSKHCSQQALSNFSSPSVFKYERVMLRPATSHVIN